MMFSCNWDLKNEHYCPVYLCLMKADFLRIRENIFHLTLLNTRLFLLPVFRRQQICVVLQEKTSDLGFPSRKLPNCSGNTSFLATGYQGSADISSSSLRGNGILRNCNQ
jgi:hypothetical protein